MKASDVYVRARQLFGFLLPGLIWLAAACVIFLQAPLKELLDCAAHATAISALAFLAVAFVLGVATQAVSYRFAKWCGDTSLVRRLTSSADAYDQRLYEEASRRLTEVGVQPVLAKSNQGTETYRERRQVFLKAKWYVLVYLPQLGHRLLEVESEINIVGMTMLPLALFQLVFLSRLCELAQLPVRGPNAAWMWGVLLVVTVIFSTVLLALAFVEARRQEERLVFESFLLASMINRVNDKKDTAGEDPDDE